MTDSPGKTKRGADCRREECDHPAASGHLALSEGRAILIQILVHLSNSLPRWSFQCRSWREKSLPNSYDLKVVAQEQLVRCSVWDTDALSRDNPGHPQCWYLMTLDWRCQFHGDGMAVHEVLYDHTGQVQAEAVVDGRLECVRSVARSPRGNGQGGWRLRRFQRYRSRTCQRRRDIGPHLPAALTKRQEVVV